MTAQQITVTPQSLHELADGLANQNSHAEEMAKLFSCAAFIPEMTELLEYAGHSFVWSDSPSDRKILERIRAVINGMGGDA